MVRFLLFVPEMWLGEPHFRHKERILPPCRRRIGLFIQVNTWLETDRVTRVINRSYVVDIQTGRFTRWKLDSPPAVWYFFFLFHEHVAQGANFREKDLVFSALLGQ